MLREKLLEKNQNRYIEKQSPNIEAAISKIVHGEQWDILYNEIIDKPSPEGKLKYTFSSGEEDLHSFEDYMIATLPLINLKNIMTYKSAKLLSKTKGYLKNERDVL